MHGEGLYIWAESGSKYDGHWFDGQKDGQGKFTWTNGNEYTGQFKDNMFHYKGTYSWANGNKYTGEWFKNNKHNSGIYVENDIKYSVFHEHGKLLKKVRF